jgi:hypothetical protein
MQLHTTPCEHPHFASLTASSYMACPSVSALMAVLCTGPLHTREHRARHAWQPIADVVHGSNMSVPRQVKTTTPAVYKASPGIP